RAARDRDRARDRNGRRSARPAGAADAAPPKETDRPRLVARARKFLLAGLRPALIGRHLLLGSVLVPAGPGAVERAMRERALRLLLAVLVEGHRVPMPLAVGVVLFESQLSVRVPLLRDAVLLPAAVFLNARARSVGIPRLPESLAF